jgi:nucleotide-binding universal stress UspA family protein
MYDRILVPVDGGVTASQGLKEALKIAKFHGSKIHLIHIVDDLPAVEPSGGTGGGEFVMAQLRDIGQSVLDTSAKEAQKSGIVVETELVEQIGRRACDLILEAARACSASLIVCGTHGRRGLSRIALGSTAEEIVRRSNVPVLLVPPGAASAPRTVSKNTADST